MEAPEKLQDLKALRVAVVSQRTSVIRLSNDHSYRERRLENVMQRIGRLKSVLDQAVAEMSSIQQATDEVAIGEQLTALDGRIKQLDSLIIHAEQRVRIERLLKIKQQMALLGAELPESLLEQALAIPAEAGAGAGDPDAVDEDVILS